MKKILFSISILVSANLFGQSPNDSIYTKNIALRAQLIAYLTPLTTNPDNDSLYNVFLKWRAALRNNPSISGNTNVTTDTIPTVELANMYNYVLNNANGMNVLSVMQPQLVAARSANPYLDRLCSAYEAIYTGRLAAQIQTGRKLLLGR